MILKLKNVQQLCVIILVYVYLFVAIHVGISQRFFPALRAAVLEEVLPGDVVVEFGDGDGIRRIRILVVRASHSSCKMYTEGHPKKWKNNTSQYLEWKAIACHEALWLWHTVTVGSGQRELSATGIKETVEATVAKEGHVTRHRLSEMSAFDFMLFF